MNLEEITLTEINQPRKTNTVGFHLYKVSKAVECVETGSKMVVARFLGREKRSGKKKSFKNHTGRHQQIDRVGRFYLIPTHSHRNTNFRTKFIRTLGYSQRFTAAKQMLNK